MVKYVESSCTKFLYALFHGSWTLLCQLTVYVCVAELISHPGRSLRMQAFCSFLVNSFVIFHACQSGSQ